MDLSGSVVDVAPSLLGATLTHRTDAGSVSVVLTEVEAYDGDQDPASHAFRGQTPRNRVMFGPAGCLYVYRSHGLHWCANIVTGVEGRASAVLLRAGRLIEGHALARQRRGPSVAERDLTRGPGRLCQALGIDGSHDGIALDGTDSVFVTMPREPAHSLSIRSGPRVGVSKAADRPWRFWIEDDPSVSPYRRSPRAA